MHCDATIEIHRVPHGAEFALTRSRLAVVEVIKPARRYCISTNTFFEWLGTRVALLAWVDGYFFTPVFSGARGNVCHQNGLSLFEHHQHLLGKVDLNV